MEAMRLGIIGCGNISDIYFDAAKKFNILSNMACADIDIDKAKEKAEKHDIPKVYSVDDLLNDPEINTVVNLTIPSAHFQISLSALEAGKNVYAEKPLSLNLYQGDRLIMEASRRGLRIGCAPDTFLGAGIQTCRKLIDDGAIGVPVAATGFMLSHGPEQWHPNPEFFYKQGGGPLFDMGPYYLTAMVALLGPIKQVTAVARASFPERTIGSGERKGQKITVETPTHIASVISFASGAIATLTTSFDVWAAETKPIEIYGSEGTISVPDPNTFGGPVRLKRFDTTEWKEIPLTHGWSSNSRGIGVADMAYAQQANEPHRANGELANHVLEAMNGMLEAAYINAHYNMKTTCDQPAPLPEQWPNAN